MKQLAFTILSLLAIATLAGCAASYNDLMYPDARYDPGDQ
jgi:hypothetical protein